MRDTLPRRTAGPDDTVVVRPGRLARLRAAVWRHRRIVLVVGVIVLSGLIVATMLRYPAPKPGITPDPAAMEPGTPVASAPATPAASIPPPLLNGHVTPGELLIPEIGVRSSFVHLGLNRDGTLQAPTRFDVVGWYAKGPAPGDAGGPPAVFAGHVDSKAGPGVFFRLRELKVGSEFVIGGTDGAERRFKVYKTANYRKDAFPDKQVYAPSKKAEVRLITCTGTFNSDTGHYEGNLVIYATMVGV